MYSFLLSVDARKFHRQCTNGTHTFTKFPTCSDARHNGYPPLLEAPVAAPMLLQVGNQRIKLLFTLYRTTTRNNTICLGQINRLFFRLYNSNNLDSRIRIFQVHGHRFHFSRIPRILGRPNAPGRTVNILQSPVIAISEKVFPQTENEWLRLPHHLTSTL